MQPTSIQLRLCLPKADPSIAWARLQLNLKLWREIRLS
jgi:hypothetical protein